MPGNRKGIPNKNKQALIALLKKQYPDYHPVLALAEIGHDMENSVEVRLSAHKEVAQYVTPKLKAIELTGDNGGPIRIYASDVDENI